MRTHHEKLFKTHQVSLLILQQHTVNTETSQLRVKDAKEINDNNLINYKVAEGLQLDVPNDQSIDPADCQVD